MSLLKAFMMEKPNIMYATIKGSLTESPSGVFSGFSNSDYLQNNNTISQDITNFVIRFKFSLASSQGTSTNGELFYFGGVSTTYIARLIWSETYHNPVIYLYDWTTQTLKSQALGYTLDRDTNYILEVSFNNGTGTYNAYNESGTLLKSVAISGDFNLKTTNKIVIGKTDDVGNIYLDGNSYIKLGSTKYKLQAVVGYTVVGSPTITDGVVSGFSFTSYNSGNYLQINNGQINFSTDDFKIKLCASKINTVSTQETLIATTNNYPMGIYVFSNRVELRLYTSNNTLIQKPIEYDISSNTKFYISLEKKGNNFIFGVSLDNINFTYNNFVQADIQTGNKTISIGHDYYRACPDCAIYLNETTIYKNNKLWFNGQQS